ncbi:MAG TPA: EamA family transporter [Burkholderiaceae bacterium]|nr:EamA family transporter [Burkholderiaceae bacterium]
MTPSTFGFILAGVLLNVAAQLLLKAGVAPLGAIVVGADTVIPTVLQVLRQWPVLAGLSCYVVSVGVWIVGLSRVDVSLAYPMLSLGYVVNAVAAWLLFGEVLTLARCAGIGLILVGVLVMARA